MAAPLLAPSVKERGLFFLPRLWGLACEKC